MKNAYEDYMLNLLSNFTVININDENYVKSDDVEKIIRLLQFDWTELSDDIIISNCITKSSPTYGGVYEKISVNLVCEYVKYEYDCWDYPTVLTEKQDMSTEVWNNYVGEAKIQYLKNTLMYI